MPSEKARSLDHFYELLATGQHPKIELDFDVAADDFFKIATEFGDIGARITRVKDQAAEGINTRPESLQQITGLCASLSVIPDRTARRAGKSSPAGANQAQ